uniref:Uncharacterized protein n=1 Tax=Acrobeloides nanus TaxID=290746 RepID=A0A914ELU3_9BILA
MGVSYLIRSLRRDERHADVEYGKYLSDMIKQTIESTYSSEQTCHFPILDPFDSSITKFIQHPEPLRCHFKQPKFTFTKLNKVYIDKELAQKFQLEKLTYRTFLRANGSDSSVLLGTWKIFDDVVDLKGSNGIVVRGRYNGSFTYSNVHASVVPKFRKSIANYSKIRPSVLIIGIDSISRSNAVRNLPQSYRYLMDELGGWEMRGYAKIDDNTFPNILALLTGYKVNVKTSELPLNPARDFVDEWPFIWKNFSQQGYTTLLAGKPCL